MIHDVVDLSSAQIVEQLSPLVCRGGVIINQPIQVGDLLA